MGGWLGPEEGKTMNERGKLFDVLGLKTGRNL